MSPARNHCSYSCNLSVTGALKAGRVIKVALINSFQTNLREFSHSPLCLKEVMVFLNTLLISPTLPRITTLWFIYWTGLYQCIRRGLINEILAQKKCFFFT